MNKTKCIGSGLAALLLALVVLPVKAQSFRVQCPLMTATHPDGSGIKCQQISGGDGFATMGDGHQIYLFGFGPLSGLGEIAQGLPGTMDPATFNVATPLPLAFPGAPDPAYAFNGAIGLAGDQSIDISNTATATANVDALGQLATLTLNTGGSGYLRRPAVVVAPPPCRPLSNAATSTCRRAAATAVLSGDTVANIIVTRTGVGYDPNAPMPAVTIAAPAASACSTSSSVTPGACVTGHIDPRLVMDVGVMNASEPAPLMAIEEDDEFFLTLSNVGQIMRPDLFEQHTVHFHGYPNASAFYDGVPDASIAINIGGSFTYYYLAPDAGTYFWHCHISPPEHLQMGMVGQIFVRPRQNRVIGNLHDTLVAYEGPANSSILNGSNADAKVAEYDRLRKACNGDILCSSPVPAANAAVNDGTKMYAYNDGDGSTQYDVEYPIQIMEFDPNFHFVGMTFNPESFTDMKDKYFLLNGRSYPDTVGSINSTATENVPGPLQTMSTDGTMHTSQPLPAVVNIPAGGRALLRLSNLDVTEYQTLASLGVPMHVVGVNARLLRDQAGNDMTYVTNSITMAGGESMDVILDASSADYQPGQKFYLYTPNLDHLSNDAENFGGLMTEVNICKSVDPQTKACSNT
jgi:FtsP/CotA-like multicopper oxidase with cupredoxin domain